jgi:hypothetical protein
MTNNTFKKLILTLSMISLSWLPAAYAAGDGPTAGGLGSNIVANDRLGATDVYLLSCPRGTRSARAKINEGNNDAAPLSVQVINPHGTIVTTNGVNGGLSPEAILNNGPGAYLVSVHKNGPGFEGYTITLDCYDVNGNRFVGNQSLLIQNQ